MSLVLAELKTEPLTAEAFAPYGQVIECAGRASYTINAGSSQRFTDLAQLESDAAGRLALSIFRAEAQRLPCPLHTLERHPLGSQAFMPLVGQRFIVVAGDSPDPATWRAFVSNGRQGVNFCRGAWHHPLLAIDAGEFLVADRIGPGDNCEAVDIVDLGLSVHC